MKNNTCIAIGILIGVSVLIISGWFSSSDLAKAATDTLGLSADISTSVTCSTEPGQTGFETLTTAAVFTATSTATTTMSCNIAAGCTLYVKDTGQGAGQPGLYSSSAGDLIDSAQAALSASTEGYGIQAATTSAGTGVELLIDAAYKYTGDNVGGLTTGNLAITSSDDPVSGKLTIVTYKAAISGLNKAGNYVDTVTFECTTN